MTSPTGQPWPTTVFRSLHPAEVATVVVAMGLHESASVDVVFGLVDMAGRYAGLLDAAGLLDTAGLVVAAVAVQVEAPGSEWVVHGAFGITGPRVADRLRTELTAAGLRVGARRLTFPTHALGTCHRLLAVGSAPAELLGSDGEKPLFTGWYLDLE